MRKTILILLLTIFATYTFAQINNMKPNAQKSILLGVNFANIETLEANSHSILIGFDYGYFHFDASSNFAVGKGEYEYLEFMTYGTYKEKTRGWTLINLGINIEPLENFILTPKIGYLYIYSIYTTPILFNSYFTQKYKTKLVTAVNFKHNIEHFSIFAGYTFNKEIISMGVGLNW